MKIIIKLYIYNIELIKLLLSKNIKYLILYCHLD